MAKYRLSENTTEMVKLQFAILASNNTNATGFKGILKYMEHLRTAGFKGLFFTAEVTLFFLDLSRKWETLKMISKRKKCWYYPH